MRQLCPLPIGHLLAMNLTHAPHHVEVSLNEIFPALTRLNILLLDVESLADSKQLLGSKNPTIIGDEALRSSKLLYSRIQDNQDTGQVLALKDIAGENGTRESIHHSDDIKGAFDLRNTMFFDVANIDAPPLMARSRLERMRLWLVWLF